MVTVNSGQLPTAKGVEEGYDLALVIGKWQSVAQGRFRNDCRDLLQMIEETDELRLWEKNVGGFTYASRDEFLKKKVLIDYDLTENALKDIVGKLKQGENADLSKFAKQTQEHEDWSERHEGGESDRKIAETEGVSHMTVNRRRNKIPVVPQEAVTLKRDSNARRLYLSKDASLAATKIREKFGDEFAQQLRNAL